MNKKIQQRIVGSVAVIALLILVAPHIFSSKDYKIPAQNETQSNHQTKPATNNNFDDFQTSVISVDPIPKIPGHTAPLEESNEPISEKLWNNVTETDNTNDNRSVAEQLLAEANQQVNTAHNTNQAANSNQLPKIELIGSAQKKPTSNTSTAKPKTAQPKFSWYVQVGSYSSKDNAKKVMMEYKKRGYASEVAYLSGQYKVRIGPLKTQDNAKNVQSELKRHGVNSYIIQIQ